MLTRVLALFLVLAVSPLAYGDDKPHVYMNTTLGDLVIELYPDKAPITVENFLQYTRDGFYPKTVFHRVVRNFVCQGGGLDLNGNRVPVKDGIKNEADNGLLNLKYTLSMARTRSPHSATSQFFINAKHNKNLDHKSTENGSTWGYAVFGKVVAGTDTVDLIMDCETGYDPKMNASSKPVTPIEILECRELKAEELEQIMGSVGGRNPDADLLAQQLEQAKTFLEGKSADLSSARQTDSGLWYVPVTEGSGDAPKRSDRVEVHYTGWHVNGDKFDSSRDRGQPSTFGLTQVIKGWTEGLQLMKPGGRAFLVIPWDLAYGPKDGRMPGKSTLIFDVELIQVVAAPKKEKTAAAPEKPLAEGVEAQIQQAQEFLTEKKIDLSKAYKTDSGMWVVHVKDGDGTNPSATDKVEVHYTGWLTNGSKFDSSRDRGRTSSFGLNQVIKGWTEGLQLMKPGGRTYFVIPPEIAYGSRRKSKIPANSVLIFDVELFKVK